jgi:hypothetical protein
MLAAFSLIGQRNNPAFLYLWRNKEHNNNESSFAISFFSLPEYVGPILIHTPNRVIDQELPGVWLTACLSCRSTTGC